MEICVSLLLAVPVPEQPLASWILPLDMISIFYLTSNFNDVCLPEEADIHYFKLLNKRRVSCCLCSARSSECPRTSSASLLVCVFECFAIVPSLLSITSLSKQNRIQTCCLASRRSLQGAHCEQACVCVCLDPPEC